MEDLRDRNNTSFPSELATLLQNLEYDKSDILQYHQRIAHDYLLKYPRIRGILGYQGMGSGKSILAVSIANSVSEKFPKMKILIIAAKSLHNNMRDNIRKYLNLKAEKEGSQKLWNSHELDEHISRSYKFVSLNAGNMLKQVYQANKPETLDDISDIVPTDTSMVEEQLKKIHEVGDLNNTFVIVDEAHNFFNSVVHGSKNAIGLYNLIMNAKQIKLLFLTGSPIVNDPFEIAVCYNMLAGKLVDTSNRGAENTLFGEDYSDFIRYFIQDSSGLNLDSGRTISPQIKNADKFANRIMGLTSYYSTRFGAAKNSFPTLLELDVVTVNMSGKQFGIYVLARDQELEESKRGVFREKKKPLQKPGGATSTYRVRSRQISNFLYPPYASSSFQDEKGIFRYQKDITKLKPETFDISELEIWSPKLLQALIRISRHTLSGVLNEFKKIDPEPKKSGKEVGPVLFYSQFRDSGILLLAKALEHYGFQEVKGLSDVLGDAKKAAKTFCIIAGDIDPDARTELLKVFTDPKNIHGAVIPILLFTSAGAEGMDTKYVRAVLAFDPYWHWSRMEQVFNRGARFRSHIDLPEKDQTVRPYLFLSDYPIASKAPKLKVAEDTTDITLYTKALQNRKLIDQFLQTIKQSSIDCSLWNKDPQNDLEKIYCRMCIPTDRLLFVTNLDKDIKSPSTCIFDEPPVVKEKVKVNSITISTKSGKIEYKYAFDESGQLHIYQFIPSLDGYEEVDIDVPEYAEIKDAILRKKKK